MICPCCKDGNAFVYVDDKGGACAVCGERSPYESAAESVRQGTIEHRLDELGSVLRLFRRQLGLGDSFRSFNLDRARGLLDEIGKLETLPTSAFERRPKQRKVNAKVH